MSDTPRTYAEIHSKDPCFSRNVVTVDANFACQLEMELNAANERIKQLEEALSCVVPTCLGLHHSKKHRHKYNEPCPFEKLVFKAKEAKP